MDFWRRFIIVVSNTRNWEEMEKSVQIVSRKNLTSIKEQVLQSPWTSLSKNISGLWYSFEERITPMMFSRNFFQFLYYNILKLNSSMQISFFFIKLKYVVYDFIINILFFKVNLYAKYGKCLFNFVKIMATFLI